MPKPWLEQIGWSQSLYIANTVFVFVLFFTFFDLALCLALGESLRYFYLNETALILRYAHDIKCISLNASGFKTLMVPFQPWEC